MFKTCFRICCRIQLNWLCWWFTSTSKWAEVGEVDVLNISSKGIKEWEADKQENWRVREKGRAFTWHPLIIRWNFSLTTILRHQLDSNSVSPFINLTHLRSNFLINPYYLCIHRFATHLLHITDIFLTFPTCPTFPSNTLNTTNSSLIKFWTSILNSFIIIVNSS